VTQNKPFLKRWCWRN